MKLKHKNTQGTPTPSSAETLRCFTRGIHYQWATPDGTIHRGHTAILAHTKRGLARAERQFWRQFRHVAPVTQEAA